MFLIKSFINFNRKKKQATYYYAQYHPGKEALTPNWKARSKLCLAVHKASSAYSVLPKKTIGTVSKFIHYIR